MFIVVLELRSSQTRMHIWKSSLINFETLSLTYLLGKVLAQSDFKRDFKQCLVGDSDLGSLISLRLSLGSKFFIGTYSNLGIEDCFRNICQLRYMKILWKHVCLWKQAFDINAINHYFIVIVTVVTLLFLLLQRMWWKYLTGVSELRRLNID